MPSLTLEKTLAPVPATQRNVGIHLSYDAHSHSVAFGCGKSAYIRCLEDDFSIQFTGHGTANVTVVRFSPIAGSQYVCSGDDQGKVMVWSWSRDSEPALKSEFQVLAGAISDISWDMEGRRLCVVGEGRDRFGAFISWDTGNSLGEVAGHSKRINACHIKQSRPMRCFTVSDDGAVVFYQGPPFRFTASDRSHHDQGKFIRDVRFSPGAGTYAVSVGSDRKIVCFDGKSGEFLKYVDDPDEEIKGGFFAVDWINEGDNSKHFVTVSADATIRLWDVESSKCLQKWALEPVLPNQQVGVVTAGTDTIVSLSLDGTLNVFKIGEHSVIQKIEGHNKGITALTANPLVTGSYDGRIVEWDDKQVGKMRNSHSNMIVAIDNTCGVSTVSWDDTLEIKGEIKHKFTAQPKIAAAYEGAFAIVTSEDELLIMDAQNGNVVNSHKLTEPGSAITLGKEYVAVGYEQSKTIELFKVSDFSISFKLPTPLQAAPSCLSLSPSEKYLAAGDVMGKILLFDVDSKSVKTSRWTFHTGKINSMSWRPAEEDEEDLIATGSLDTHLFIYSVKRPMKIVKQLNAHKDGVSVVTWESPDCVLSSGADACIRRWKLNLD